MEGGKVRAGGYITILWCQHRMTSSYARTVTDTHTSTHTVCVSVWLISQVPNSGDHMTQQMEMTGWADKPKHVLLWKVYFLCSLHGPLCFLFCHLLHLIWLIHLPQTEHWNTHMHAHTLSCSSSSLLVIFLLLLFFFSLVFLLFFPSLSWRIGVPGCIWPTAAVRHHVLSHTGNAITYQGIPEAQSVYSISMATVSHPVIFLPQFLCLLLVRLLLRLSQFAPHLAEFLCAVADGQTRILLLHTGTVLTAEHEERRPATQGQHGRELQRWHNARLCQ